jgi:response regulator RpfG family c-di-GMP phosphodiesterase
MELSFIVIDDSELDCFIARKIIAHIDKSLTVKTFQNSLDALKSINETVARDDIITIILLDLQMPLMNGFQFVEEFEKMPSEAQRNFLIVALSSTRNSSDIFRMLTYNAVYSMIEKPLTKEKFFSLIHEVRSVN